MALAVLIVVAGITKKFRGDPTIKKPTLDTVNNTIGIVSGMYTIYTTLTCYDTIAGGTLSVEG